MGIVPGTEDFMRLPQMADAFLTARPVRLCRLWWCAFGIRMRTCEDVPVQQASTIVAVIVQRQVEDSCAVPRVHVHIVHRRVLRWVVFAIIIGIIYSQSWVLKLCVFVEADSVPCDTQALHSKPESLLSAFVD